MEAINYANGFNMTLPADAQIVQGVSGNAVYLPAGAGTMPIAGNRNELTISLWRQWDGVVDSAAYRGIFEIANIKVYFDQATDFLTIELAGNKTVTEIKDDQEQTHWCFLFSKNSFFKIYKNAELKAELTTGNYPVDFSEGFTLGGGRTHATFDEVRMYKTVVTESEIRGLYSLVTKGTQVKQLENIVASVTPKYLGMVETVPDTRTAIIRQGEKLGAVDANPGDWVLMGKTIGGWKVGVCYRWTGAQWLNLQPEVNYAKEYQACLVHLFEIEELKQQTEHFGALFAKVLVAQEAFVEKLVAQEAFIKKLSGDIAFLNRLIVKKLHIDTIEGDEHNDFEAWFDELNGLKIRNKGEEIFKIDTNGDVFAKNAFLQDGTFTGEIFSGPLRLSPQQPTAQEINVTTSETAEDIYNRFGRVDYPVKSKDGLDDIIGFKTFYSEWTESYDEGDFGEVGWRKMRLYHVEINASTPYGRGNGDFATFGKTVDKRRTNGFWFGTIPDKDFSETNHNLKRDHNLEVLSGGKTFVLLDLPKEQPALTGAVWTNGKDGILRIKN